MSDTSMFKALSQSFLSDLNSPPLIIPKFNAGQTAQCMGKRWYFLQMSKKSLLGLGPAAMSFPHWREIRTGLAQWNQHFSGNDKCYNIVHELDSEPGTGMAKYYLPLHPSEIILFALLSESIIQVGIAGQLAGELRTHSLDNAQHLSCCPACAAPCSGRVWPKGRAAFQHQMFFLCLNKALEINSQSKHLGITWVIPSPRALHFTCFGTSFKYFRKTFQQQREKIQNPSWS